MLISRTDPIAMNNVIYLIGLIFIFKTSVMRSQDLPDRERLRLAEKTSPQWKWGDATNDIVGGIFTSENQDQGRTVYSVYVHEEFAKTTGPTHYSEPDTNSLKWGLFRKKQTDTNEAGTYFKAPNGLCGPVTLSDSNGIPVKPRNADLVSFQAFPKSLRLSELGSLDAFHRRTLSRLVGQLPYLSSFTLEECFQVKESGRYVLTVWPKVYRQLSNSDDLCVRIDLPPISVPIEVKSRGEFRKILSNYRPIPNG